MDIKLQIAFRNTNDGIKCQIRKQHARDLHYVDNITGVSIKCASMPQLTRSVIYLQGDMISEDMKWVETRTMDLTALIQTLMNWAGHFGWSVDIGAEPDEIIMTLHYDTLSYQAFNRNVYDIVLMIKSRILSIPNQMNEKLKCQFCSSEKDVQTFLTSGSVAIACKSCQSNFKACNSCGGLSESLTKNINSLGKEKEICSRCNKKINCEGCNFNELVSDTKSLHSINENGRNKAVRGCLKCSKEHIRCRYCSSYYPKTYYKCPCRVPREFKDLGIHSHNADVTQILHTDSDAEIGMEIEVGVKCSNRLKYEEIYSHSMKLLENRAIAVYDSSIDYIDGSLKQIPNSFRGFEIVTRPMNYDNMTEFVNNLTDKRHGDLRSWDVETTGVHIHIARYKTDRNGKRLPFITKIEIGKLLVFINDIRNRRLIKHIARRYNQRFARLANKRIVDCKDMSPECHYNAINTNKRHTIEFRIFRGSLNKETLFSYIQFVYSAIEFVRATPTVKLTSVEYMEWLNKTNKSQYRDLKKRVATYTKRNQLTVGGEA